jgi:hypothetical protein
MTKNQTIAILIEGAKDSQTQTDAENLQYNLLGRGYRWDLNLTGKTSGEYFDCSGWTSWTLYINTATKLLKWAPSADEMRANEVAYHVMRLWSADMSIVIQNILFPPKPPPDYTEIQGADSDCDQKVRVYDDKDTVEFYEEGDHILTTSKAVINGVAKALGLPTDTKAVAVVQFSYPSSGDSWDKVIRRVQLISLDSEFLTGIELSRGSNTTNTFKKYRVSKLCSEIKLYSFDTE